MQQTNRALYEEVILEHNRKPRNFHSMEDAARKIEGHNPLCGDHFTVYLKLEGDVISDISFEGKGCAISKSSASLMTTLLKGKTVRDAENLFVQFHRMVTSNPDAPIDEKAIGKLAVFSGVREFPVRIKCATLSWHAVLSALRGAGEAVTTE
ncbi:MAG TPA: SUF system NifU family Fe-S cluster assembly protein [Candidatus Hydrogenedentes bacterium]|nr:SUF system NifU family Fe-S cluster assembly protein [Candidatus Hydrogenedentota bacterium]HQE83950.1 SUF system NifU family Fe-S cluster assembly protein [Candidatus Hydrogenedentota bacterium]HQH51796.1 SUF system NifU family Fe-S cluster assembly protein [Candidatus Hydrogenedentota bacterium]HQM48383.1 SUF system NifU family Fe-S cluster assembly protein [Candidatus Hydrogenedentota bacterium]